MLLDCITQNNIWSPTQYHMARGEIRGFPNEWQVEYSPTMQFSLPSCYLLLGPHIPQHTILRHSPFDATMTTHTTLVVTKFKSCRYYSHLSIVFPFTDHIQ